MSIVDAARELAKAAHAGQKRKWTGGEYFSHPSRVAHRVERMGGSEEMVAAAYLHDVLEDTDIDDKTILAATNVEVLTLVYELTNPTMRSNAPRAVRKRIDRDHLAGVSHRAKVIKLIDRIDNLREMGDCPKDFRELYAGESLDLAEALDGTDLDLELELRAVARELFNSAGSA